MFLAQVSTWIETLVINGWYNFLKFIFNSIWFKIQYSQTGGSSTDPCSDIYAGPNANSELETQAVQSALNKHLGQWDSYLTIHS